MDDVYDCTRWRKEHDMRMKRYDRLNLLAAVLVWSAAAAIFFLGSSCVADNGIVGKTRFEGEGTVAVSQTYAVAVVHGTAEAGVYQMSGDGELRLSYPALASKDAVRIRAWDKSVDATFPLGAPLPAWTEVIIRSVLTQDEITHLGLMWTAGA